MPTRTNRHQQSFTTDSSAAQTTSSFTPGNSVLLVVLAYFTATSNDGSRGTTLTITDSAGLTWTSREATTAAPNWSYGIRAWTAPVTTGVSMTVSVDVGATTIDAMRIEVYEYSDYDTVTPVGATAIGSDADGAGAASVTLSASPLSSSEVLAMAGFTLNTSTAGTVTEGAGWTELFDTSLIAGASFGHAQSQVRGSSTSTSVDWANLEATGDTVGATLLALEIRDVSASVAQNQLAWTVA